MNTIYVKTKKSQRKIKSFNFGEYDKAMQFGWDLAYKNQNNEYFIITENEKCLKFNLQTIV
jgi:hypothetical protein